MAITTLTPLDTLPTAPSMADPVNFPVRGDAFMAALMVLQTQMNALLPGITNNATEAKNQAQAALDSYNATAASAALAAGYAGATAWVSGTTYAIGDKRYSLIDGRVYRRLTASAGSTDPSADATNWKIDNNAPLLRKDVAGTTQTGAAGYDYWANNVAATTLTLPATPADGDKIAFTPANGLKTNSIDSGSVTVRGPAGTASGVITLNLGARMQLQYSSTITAWVTV